jgi:uncharacterized membrane protein
MSGVGGALLLTGVSRSNSRGALAATVGAACVARSLINIPLRQFVGASGRRAMDVHKMLLIHAPVERVFDTLARFEEYPHFMRTVRSVRSQSNGHLHWTVTGPAGLPLEWEAEVIALERPRTIAWRTVPNSTIGHAGTIRLEPWNGATRLDIRMSYSPPAGVLGHAVASALAANPKRLLDEEMLRVKTFLESGRTPRDAAARATVAAQAGQG